MLSLERYWPTPIRAEGDQTYSSINNLTYLWYTRLIVDLVSSILIHVPFTKTLASTCTSSLYTSLSGGQGSHLLLGRFSASGSLATKWRWSCPASRRTRSSLLSNDDLSVRCLLTKIWVSFSAIFHLYSEPPAGNRRDLRRCKSFVRGHMSSLDTYLLVAFFRRRQSLMSYCW